MKRVPAVLLFAIVALPSLAQVARQSVYIEPQNGFETYVAAAIAKKQVPIDVVTDPARATYKLKAAPVEIRQESTGGKVARCLFAYCAGIEDKGNVSVQLIDTNSSKMVWAYSVNKQRGGSKNQQSMAEAIAKHFKDFLLVAPPAAVPSQTLAPTVVIFPAPAPAVLILAQTPTPLTPALYQQQNNVHLAPAMETRWQPARAEESPAGAARRMKQHKACLELAKDNPSVSCN